MENLQEGAWYRARSGCVTTALALTQTVRVSWQCSGCAWGQSRPWRQKLSSWDLCVGGSEPKTLDHSAEYMEAASALRSTAQELGGKQLSFVADACLCYVHVMQQKWGFPVFF